MIFYVFQVLALYLNTRKICKQAAEWLLNSLKEAGLENVSIDETDGHPVVYGDWLHAEGKPTILVYGHYDVQPVDPLELMGKRLHSNLKCATINCMHVVQVTTKDKYSCM